MSVKTAPYGSWKSPITADLIVGGSVALSQVALDGEETYWVEGRPTEGGRNCIVRRGRDGRAEDVTPREFNARTRVHEYGGGDYAVADGTIYFSNFTDQRLYRQMRGASSNYSAPEPVTPEGALRFADFSVDRRRGLVYCVREDHARGGEPENSVVRVRADGDAEGGRVVVSGGDFYAAPRLSPDGGRLAWLTWNHPNMPWDGSELWVGELDEEGMVVSKRLVAGGPEESVVQPEWSPAGVLHFASDRTCWWNLYRLEADGSVRRLHSKEAEFGFPLWVFGLSFYGFASAERLVCAYVERGESRLALLDAASGGLEEFETPYRDITSVKVSGPRAVFRAGSPNERAAVVELNLETRARRVLRRSSEAEVDEGYISAARAVEYPTEGGLTAHAFYYAPRNKDFDAPEGERPPLVVKCHGGPTSMTTTTLRLEIQFWTSRGFAVLDVNYGGSTGYGREYRLRLNDRWGIVDVDDCVKGARHLVGQGLADGARCAITGGSAGGFTVLNTLTFRDLFRAGASHYGVSDLGALVRDTHKFESRYLEGLVGPYPAREDIYRERSSINFTERLSCPLIFFQGLEDKVVPPNQAETMVEALRRKGLPVAYVAFEGEQHGFRRAENIKRALEGELYFYSRVFGFDLADPVEPVEIENL